MRDRSDWMLNPSIFRRIMCRFSYLKVNLFAKRLTYQLPRFFSWRPDPLAEETDAFLQDWMHLKGYANPPWNLIGRVGESGGARSGCRPNSASVAITALVPQTSGATGIIPPENQPSSGGSNDGRAAASSGTTSGCVAYLQQHYASKKLSWEAADLLLSSWRQKSSQSYDSLCKKWIGWCTERQANPVSGPIEDVVNFLAHLFHEGYQYRSLNAYRSAIASMHTLVDGLSIGQHPLVSRLLKGRSKHAHHCRDTKVYGM